MSGFGSVHVRAVPTATSTVSRARQRTCPAVLVAEVTKDIPYRVYRRTNRSRHDEADGGTRRPRGLLGHA